MNSPWDAELSALYQRIKDGRIDGQEAACEIEALRRRIRDQPNASGGYLQTELFTHDEPYLADHLVFGDRVLLGVTHGSLAMDMFFRRFPEASSVQLRQLRFIEPVVVRAQRSVEVLVRPQEGGAEQEFAALFREAGTADWDTAASGKLSRIEFSPEQRDLGSVKDLLTPYDDCEALYPHSDAIRLGESFKILKELYRGSDQVLARVVLSDTSRQESHSYSLHPLIINSAFSMLAALSEEKAAEATFLPFGIKQIQFHKTSPLDACWLRLQLVRDSGEMILFDVDVLTEEGQVTARLKGCSVKRVRTVTAEPAPSRRTATAPTAATAGLEQQIEAYLLQKVAQISEIADAEIDVESNLMDLGLSSVQLVETGTSVAQDTGLELDPTLFFEYPSIAELTRFFADEHGQVFAGILSRDHTREAPARTVAQAPKPEVPRMETASPRPIADRPVRGGDIAVIGMHGVFPDAEDPEALWEHLRDGKDLIREIPLDHWDYKPWFNPDPGAGDFTYSKWGSFIDDVGCFDAEFFRISPREAQYMDPQVRLFLQSLYACAEDAGVVRRLRGTSTGVFAGICFNDYSDKMVEMGLPIDPYTGTGVGAIAANRASFWFDFTGPSFVIDTACSSSLFALHSAVLALRNGECDMAFAGGANLLLSSLHYRYFCAIRALSPTGRCHSFDAAADGYVPGECVASLLLKPLEDAQRDGDRIHAVIKGSAALHGGYTSSITAPSVAGEENVILKAWENAGIDPATLTYIEAHGTGTKLGDPIEISSLNKAFRRFTREQGFCAVGSIKANLGHTEGAAGIAGVFKVILQMKHRQIPALANLQEVNPYLKLDGSPVYINRSLKSWESPHGPRRAGVSSFGFSGAYAHLVMEEYLAPEAPAVDEEGPVAIVLSARNPERLTEVARRLADRLDQDATAHLPDIAFTLQNGRESMAERLAFVADSPTELKDILRGLVAGTGVEGVFRGRVTRAGKVATAMHLDEDMAPTIQSWLRKRKLPQLLNLWVQGAELDWTALYTERKPCRIGLPSYPFAQERHWLQGPEQDPAEELARPAHPAPDAGPATKHLHPLVHANCSTLERQLYRAEFSGREFFFNDHRVGGRKMLPGVAYLEMARFALSEAAGAQSGMQLEHVIWAKPMAWEADSLAVEIEVFAQDQGLGFEIRSRKGVEDELHSRGTAVLASLPETASLDLTELRKRINRQPYTAARYYQGYRAAGIDYGPGHQGLKEVFVGDGEVLARLVLPDTVTGEGFVLHPALLDSAIQACAGMDLGGYPDSPMPVSLPFALERVDIVRPCAAGTWVWIRESALGANSDRLRKLDLDLLDDQGRVCVRLRGFSSRVFEARHEAQPIVQLCQPTWQSLPAGESRSASFPERHLLLIGFEDAELPNVSAHEYLRSAQETPDSRYQDFAIRLFEYLQALLKRKPAADILLQVCIPMLAEPGLRGLAAVLKTARAENPRLLGQLVELADARDLTKALEAGSCHPEIAELRYANTTLQALRWQAIPDKPVDALPWKENGVYLISGGAGGLGLLFAREIAVRLAKPVIVLAGRSALDEQLQGRLQDLATGGAQVFYRQADLGDPQQTSALVDAIARGYGALDGILHAAGVLHDDFIVRKSTASFAEVLLPKVAGVVNLDRATQAMDMDFMVLFSSGVAVMGNPGQVDYAAANGFLDAYAHYRSEQLGRKTVAINWPLWAEGTMGVGEAVDIGMRQAGMAALETQAGLHALDHALVLGLPQVLVMSGDPGRLMPQLNSRFSRHAHPTGPGPGQGTQVTVEQPDSGVQAVAYLKALLAKAMKTSPGRIRADEPLEQYGLDSIMVMSLTTRLEEDFGTLSKTLFFEYQTIEELAGYFQTSHARRLAQLLAGDKPDESSAPEDESSAPELAKAVQAPKPEPVSKMPKRSKRSKPGVSDDYGALDVAVIGMAGRYPQAEDLDEYWRNLRGGRDCISEVPQDRWDWRDYYSETDGSEAGGPFGVHSSKWGGFISDVDKFDSLFFNISPREAQFLDPQERLFLQTVWQAMEDAGYRREDLHAAVPGLLPGRAGVYAGVMYGEYQLFGAEQSVRGNRMAFSSSLASIANRVSFFFDLHGPSLTLDTMCSSSLMALHLACRDLKDGRTDLGIAGGVNVTIHPNKYLMLSAGQFISRRGHCESFGEGGEGYIPGEGVGVVLLKRLEDARRDGDIIHGVIKGSAVNHGGRTHGYSVPNPTAQQSVILEALKESGVDPRGISYVEAHGTGTKLGDPIEITGLTKAYAAFNAGTGYCWIGSAKSNIGHCESAAGIAGLTKVLLQMRAKEIAPSLHSQVLNPHIDFAATPFVVNQELRPWERPEVDGKTFPRVAGISSFGAGGSNAHCIIEEYREDQTADFVSNAPAAILLSAKDADRLAERVERLRRFLTASPDIDLHDLAYTLQVGREAMPERLALIVGSLDELEQRLAGFQAGRQIESLHRGQIQRDHEALVRLLEDPSTDKEVKAATQGRDLPRLLGFWVKGVDVPWKELYGEVRPRRIRLPGYPFARQRCWIKLESVAPGPTVKAPSGVSTEQAYRMPLLPKPTGIRLASRSAMTEFQAVQNGFETLSLQPPNRIDLGGAAGPNADEPAIASRVSSPPEGIHTSFLATGNTHETDARTLARQLSTTLERAAADPHAKVCVLHIGGSLPDDDHSLETWIAQDMPHRMMAFQLPLIAHMEAPGNALGWLLAGCCDLLVCQRSDGYAMREAFAYRETRELLQKRWGLGGLQADSSLSAERLQALCPGLAVLPEDVSARYAEDLGQRLAACPRESLSRLKRHLVRDFLPLVQTWALPLSPLDASAEGVGTAGQDSFSRFDAEPREDSGRFEAVSLDSPALAMQVRADGVVVLSLRDEAHKNAFSEPLVRGLAEAFDKLNANPDYKVVVLTGHGRYFSSGGTRDSLLAIQQGQARYSDAPLYELPLRCEIPVIAAMQGHAFGAGWSLGMFCDRVLLAEEALYSSRFMRYGFTPGFGATLIFPHRFGIDLGREILFSARDYQGADLRDRGISIPVLPGSQVLPQALALAGRWARAPRQDLLRAKAEAVHPLLGQLDEVVRRELEMHQATFIGNPEARQRIEAGFPDSQARPGPTPANPPAQQLPSGQLADLRDWLKQSLAAELSIPADQVADNTPFVDIGLDSISGVTWVRRINAHFKLEIQATSLYQFSTLDGFVQHVLEQGPQTSPIAAGAPPALGTLIDDHPEAAQAVQRQVLETLRGRLAKELGIEPDRVDAQAPFVDIGLDSITGVTWVRGIGEHYGLELDATKVYEHPTLTAFTRYVLEQGRSAGLSFAEPSPPMQAGPVEQPSVAEPPAPERTAARPVAVDSRMHEAAPAIAVIGMAGQFPQAEDLEQFWDNILGGVDCITEIPVERWSIDDYFDPQPGKPGKTYCRWMGALRGIDEFDADFFNISPLEAEWMDPQQRLFLQACWRCIEDAGYAPGALSGSRCGVFVGCTPGDYAELASDGMEVQKMLGGTSSILAARISYLLDLQGPCMAIDTACSSSLVAIANACDSLLLGHSDQALAGGVYALCGPAMHVMTSQAGMLSADGRCYSFDHRANGFVPAEGVGVLLLKRLSDAEQAGDDIYAVIRGWGVNQDGKTNGITAPNPDSQARLERQVYRDFGIDPNQIGLLEAHGTGTKLGDPIEIAGLKAAFSELSDREQFCALGSVKSNIGHALMAAGVAGTIKAVQSLVRAKLPPSIHCQQLNEHIQLEGSPFYLNAAAADWTVDAGLKRMAAVSSFGLSGTNAHLVVEEYPRRETAATAATQPVLIVLSARNHVRLKEAAQNLLGYLRDHPTVALANLAFTLQTGRDEMAERFATLAAKRADLMRNLQAFADGEKGAYRSGTRGDHPLAFGAEAEDRDYLDQLVRKGRLERLAELWVSGVGLPWPALWASVAPARLHGLPVYPFARERYWLPDLKEGAAPVAVDRSEEASATVILAPVWNPLHRNEALVSEPPQGRVLLIGGSQEQRNALGAIHGDCVEIESDAGRSIDQWSRLLADAGPLEQLVWIAPEPPTSLDGEAILAAQSLGLLCLMRVFKALLQLDYRNRPLAWTIITMQSQSAYAADQVLPAHAGIHGFVGSLAKEYPAWRIRLLDLAHESAGPVSELLRLPFDPQGNALAWRTGQWFRQTLIPVDALPKTVTAYRMHGVYLVIGGAGGLGEAWSRWMIEHYQARIIWIGRRAEDDAIRAKRDALARLGKRPDYRQADANRLDALRVLYRDLKQAYPVINGVVHSAVGDFDDNLAAMDEQRLRSILSVKLDAVVHMAQVFAEEDLDFALFFSSMASFGKAGGMAGYSAGSSFEDAFARAWEQSRGIRCKVVNWGYWKLGTGTAISTASKTRLGQSGMGTLEYEAGMSALKKLMDSDLHQAAVFKASDRDAVPSGERLTIYPTSFPSCIAAVRQNPALAAPRSEQIALVAQSIDDGMKESLHDMLGAILSSMNLLDEDSELTPSSRRPGYYRRWLKHSWRFLDRKQGFAPLQMQWAQWDRDKVRWLEDPHKRAVAVLAETCLRALQDILNGDRLASEVLFPNSSLDLVEGIYQGNPVSDFFNQALADTLIAVIEERLRQAPSTPIRILEIGAGTGGGTSAILPRLEAYREHVAEYAYTDISKAFLFHAQERFAADAPYLRTQLFDVSQAPAAQSMPLDHYDLALATNVLHATKNIRTTLRNAKAVLRHNGLLILNEMAENSLFGHLTFGLLEGWWLNEDQELRLPGAPGLSPGTWRQLLQGEGWRSVCFPAESAHGLGQQIVLAESDGVVRRTAAAATPVQAPAKEPAKKATANAEASPDSDSVRLKERGRVRVGKLLASALRMSSGNIDPSRPFEQYGIDSILVVQITHKLEEVFGQIDSTLLFEVRNLNGLVDHLIDKHRQTLIDWLGLTASEAPVPEDKPKLRTPVPVQASIQRRSRVEADEPIAMIGISGRYPMARDLDAFWDNLRSARDCISEVPADRWSLQGFFNPDPTDAGLKGQSYCKSGGFLDNWDEFDARFFNILPVEAMNMDPQERLFLQTAWEVLEDGGYNRALLQQRCAGNVGVFAGITKAGYNLFGPALWQQGESLFPGTSFSSVANRISYFMDLRGPSMAIDTMCSSSLSAIHEACENLRRGSCEMAIAGGVNLYVHPSSFVQLCRTQMLSPDARCKSFGIGANGFVPGEGVGAVLLKPLALAEQDGDRIHALIRATGASHGGKTNGYTVPNPSAQGRLIRETLQRAGIDARELSYIEAHGTGTELGDPIEVAGLSQAFRVDTQDTGYCALGSVKSNLGHLEAAAGIAGLTKIVLQLQHGQLAPSLHAQTLNPKIPFEQSPFRLQRELSDWRRPQLSLNGEHREGARIAGISSFGAGGSNVHAIVEEYRKETPLPEASSGPFLVVLSARNEDRLQAAVGRLAAFIRDRKPASLERLAYTLQMGREAMQERCGFIVDSRQDLLIKLDEYLQDPDSPEPVCHGRVEPGHKLDAFSEDEHLARAVEAWLDDRNLYRLLEHWVQGLAIDWARLYPDPAPSPISLPFYPFDPQAHRLPDGVDASSTHSAKRAIEQVAQAKRHMFRPVWKAKPVAEVVREQV